MSIIDTTQSIVWYDEAFDMALHERRCREWREKGFRVVPPNWPCGFMEWRFRYVILDGVSVLMKPSPCWIDRVLWKIYRWRHPVAQNNVDGKCCMPIRKDMKSRYPKDWKLRSRFVRFYRARTRITLAVAVVALSIELLAIAEPVTNAVVEVYTVVETNWFASFVTQTLLRYPPEANATTQEERGTIASNTYMRTMWSNHTHAVQIQSCPFALITRRYQDKVIREYK